MLQFGSDSAQRDSHGRKPNRPLAGRGLESRLLLLTAALGLVLVLIHETRKPERWKWLWAFQPAATATAPEAPAGKIDTRLREPPSPPSVAADGQLALTAEDAAARERLAASPATAHAPAPLASSTHLWGQLWDSLNADDRRCFATLLKAARDGRRPDPADLARWPRIGSQLAQSWDTIRQQSVPSPPNPDSPQTPEERDARQATVASWQQTWEERLQPALRALGQGDLDAEQRQTLAELQTTLDAVFLRAVRDNTVFRDSEQDAWFRLLEKLQRAELAQLERESRGQVSFAQLYREADAYRGQLVTVRGTVRLGHYRAAPRNVYGIAGYYLFWLRPVGSTNPLVVYALEVPPGFPDVRELEARGRKPELQEDAEFTGYFFKRWAYRAGDGTRLAPLVLAKAPRWQAPLVPTRDQGEGLSSVPWLILSIAGALVLALIFVAAASRYAPSRRGRSGGDVRTPAEVRQSLAELRP